ncbi:hypothetical protein [Tellurirhabdus bombi]|uniref:hypothetical protein n=1 Tax=Tellurirhabdus bombi TaxID=2907205 RepID=UPI001F33052F|nr:hypothetical protein [Tellurirhabdus bombi]
MRLTHKAILQLDLFDLLTYQKDEAGYNGECIRIEATCDGNFEGRAERGINALLDSQVFQITLDHREADDQVSHILKVEMVELELHLTRSNISRPVATYHVPVSLLKQYAGSESFLTYGDILLMIDQQLGGLSGKAATTPVAQLFSTPNRQAA